MAKTCIKITVILALLFSIIACEKATTPSASKSIDALKQHVSDLYANDEFSGSILIAQNEEVLLHVAVGYFDRANKSL